MAKLTLDHAEGSFRNVFDANPDPIVISSVADGRIVLVNREFERSSGYSRDEALGRTSIELKLWPDPGERERCAQIIKTGGELRNVDMTLQMKDGSRRPYLLSVSAVWFNDEPCNMTVARDVTELRRVETELTTAREVLASKVAALELTQRKLHRTEAELREILSVNPETLTIFRRRDLTLLGIFGAPVPGVAASGIREGEPPTAEFCRVNPAFTAVLRSVAQTGVSAESVFEYRIDSNSPATSFLTRLDAIDFGGEPCVICCARDISEQKRIQRRLEDSERSLIKQVVARQQSETKIRQIVAANVDMLVINDWQTGQYLEVNDECIRALGYSSQDLIGRTDSEVGIWPPESLSAYIALARQHRQVRGFEATLRRKDGHLLPCLNSAVVTELDGRKCLITMSRDISALKEAERKVRESECTLRTIIESSPDAITINRAADGAYIAANQGFVEMSGFSQEEVLGHSPGELGLWAKRTELKEFLKRLKAASVVRAFEYSCRLKTGEIVSALISGRLLELDGQQCVVTTTRDITEIKETETNLRAEIARRTRVEQELRDSESMVRKIIEAIPDTVTIARTSDGTYREVNEAFLKQFGYQRDEVLGKNLLDLQIWADRKEAREVMRRLRAESLVKGFEVSLRHRDGVVVPHLLSAVLTQLGSEQCVVAVAHDITKIKQTELELTAAREAALAASQAKSEFLSSMSHEIRTPMNAIVGMAELIGQGELAAEQHRYLDIVKTNCDSLLSLINDILDLAKIESGRMILDSNAFDVEEVVDKVAEMMAVRAHEKGVEITVHITPEVPRNVIGDALRLRQILVNLIGNAIKFTEKGHVSVEITGAEQVGDASDVVCDNDGRVRLQFSVIDTGLGIPRDKFGLIFSSFEQADSSTTRQYGGSGLGLAIVKRLVELYGGEISVQSEVGVGSCFTFTILCVPANSPSRTVSAQIPSLRGARVLVVAATPISRLAVRQILMPLGAEITEAKSFEEAVGLLNGMEHSALPYRLLIADCSMGGDDYMRAITDLRRVSEKEGYPLPVILMVSTDALSSKLARMRNLEMSAYIVKPIRRRDLMNAIRRALGEVEASPLQLNVQQTKTSKKLSPMRVLLAEDSPVNRLLVREYLAATPLALDEAENGQIAQEKFKSRCYDLVIMDMRMPVMDGYAATRAIREWERLNDTPRTPVIALTASALKTDVERCLEAGCDQHLSKPIKLRDLLEAIAVAVPTVHTSG